MTSLTKDTTTPQLNCDPRIWLALGFGSGLFSLAPGTAGTFVGLFIYYFALAYLPPPYYISVVIITFFLGVALCQHAEKYLQQKDHPAIVWDEMVGVWATLILVPHVWYWSCLAFLWFRLFDITKPLGISYCEKKFKGGWGVMLDDLLAAFYAWFLVQGCLMLFNCVLPEGF
jgi:phosphatidylglycerophosphatase A